MICPWKAWGVVRHYYFRCKGRGGSMEDFKVSTRKLKSDAEVIHNYTAQIEHELGGLTDDLADIGRIWGGSASETFKKIFMEDLTALTLMVFNMEKIFRYAGIAKSKYEKCESHVARVISDMK